MMRRPVRFLWLVCLMALAFGLCGCQEENAPKAALDKETASAVVAKAAAGLQAPEAPAPAEEAAAAARVLDAGNAVWRWADVAGIHAGHLLRQAEDVLLQGNPLKEAISSARFLFSRFLLGGILLREGNPDTVAVAGWRKEMEEALAVARSHTRGMTEEERRLWQAFLDKADLFPRTVAQGQEDAFSNATRRQLNLVLQEAQEAYNAFVEAHNRRDAASR